MKRFLPAAMALPAVGIVMAAHLVGCGEAPPAKSPAARPTRAASHRGGQSGAPAPSAAAESDRRETRFYRDVAPLLSKHCAECHRPGASAPFPLLSIEDAKKHARQIVAVTESRFMPPWLPEPGRGEFHGERRLTVDEIAVFRDWVDDGLVAGEGSGPPQAPPLSDGWQLGTPDMVLELPVAYTLSAEGTDVFRNFVLPSHVSSTRYVRAVEFRPENARVIHHARMRIDETGSARRLDERDAEPGYDSMLLGNARDPDGHLLTWTPGRATDHGSDDSAWRLVPGAAMVVQLHLQPSGKPEPVKFAVGLHFSQRPSQRVPVMLRIGPKGFDIPAGDDAYKIHDQYTIPRDVEARVVYPHMHYLGSEVHAYAVLPDRSRRWLLSIKGWDDHWQDDYRFVEPVRLPAGTTIHAEYVFDNSQRNPRNPHHPPQRVRYGFNAGDEMADVFLQVVPLNPADGRALRIDAAQRELAADARTYEKMHLANPADDELLMLVAQCQLELGEFESARRYFHLLATRRADDAEAHCNLATALYRLEDFQGAGEHYRRALEIDPQHAKTHNNMGVIEADQGRHEAAAIHYRQALTANPAFAMAHYHLGVSLEALDDMPGAIKCYEHALEHDPDLVAAYSSLAAAHEHLGQLDQAVSYYRRRLAIDEEDAATHNNLAWVLATASAPEFREGASAVRHARRSCELTHWQQPIAIDTLAAAYAESGRFEEAVATAQQARRVAAEAGDSALARQIDERIELYRLESPFRAGG